ncbi:hypothetical protein BGW80DRAFT_458872 [Lactifluus volemus]|nr:hypothetical protein BGW80DRAFT_458872 [Lactifluus volemus]
MSLIGASHFGTHRRPSPCYTATGHNPSYFFYSRPYRDCPTRCAFTTGVFPFFASPGLHTRSSRASGQIWESGPLLAAGAAVWDVWWDPPSDKVDGHSFRGLFPLASDSHLIRFVLSPSLSFSLSLHLHLHLTDSSFLSFSPQSCTYFAFLLTRPFPSLSLCASLFPAFFACVLLSHCLCLFHGLSILALYPSTPFVSCGFSACPP